MQNQKSDLKIRTYKFSLQIIKFINTLPNKRIFWTISDQLLRSATSIGANIIEAKAASSKRDFMKFYTIALKSANETKYWLCLLRDGTEIENKNKVEKILNETIEISNILGASLLTMKRKR